MKTTGTQGARLLSLLRQCGVIRARDLVRWHIDRKTVARVCQQGLVERCARGTYCIRSGLPHPHTRLAIACKRVPHGTVCLLSALWYHGLLPHEPALVWMAVERKARLPHVAELGFRFVRYAGEAFTQGLVNANLHGTSLRVYSPMKSVADCFKYRDKVGRKVAVAALRAAIEQNQYNRQKLLRFAEICRVKKVLTAAADRAERASEKNQAQTSTATTQLLDGELLRQQVWAEPLRQLARRYGVSDVALAKRCKKLKIPLPGRGYWAKRTRLDLPTRVD